MTVLRRALGEKAYKILLAVLLLGALLYQKETGILPEWRIPESDAPGPATGAAESSARVIRVVDGDTFEIEGGERVRLIGIDTPESVKPNAPVECFAHESSDYLRALIEGKSIRLIRDTTDRDRYARLLRYAYLGDLFVNEQLVREGYARSVAYRPDMRFQAQFDEAERQARAGTKGRWAACQ